MNEKKHSSKAAKFVNYIIDIIKTSSEVKAALKNADNHNLAYKSWGILANFNLQEESVDLENNSERIAYSTIAANIARAKIESNGELNLGRALALCNKDDPDQLSIRLRRLLSCDSTIEVCQVLRQIFSLLQSKNITNLDYIKLLEQLTYFNSELSRQNTKLNWAKEFYSKRKVVNE